MCYDIHAWVAPMKETEKGNRFKLQQKPAYPLAPPFRIGIGTGSNGQRVLTANVVLSFFGSGC